MPDNISSITAKVQQRLSKRFNVPADEGQFATILLNPGKRRKAYDALSAQYNMPTFEDFDAQLTADLQQRGLTPRASIPSYKAQVPLSASKDVLTEVKPGFISDIYASEKVPNFVKAVIANTTPGTLELLMTGRSPEDVTGEMSTLNQLIGTVGGFTTEAAFGPGGVGMKLGQRLIVGGGLRGVGGKLLAGKAVKEAIKLNASEGAAHLFLRLGVRGSADQAVVNATRIMASRGWKYGIPAVTSAAALGGYEGGRFMGEVPSSQMMVKVTDPITGEESFIPSPEYKWEGVRSVSEGAAMGAVLGVTGAATTDLIQSVLPLDRVNRIITKLPGLATTGKAATAFARTDPVTGRLLNPAERTFNATLASSKVVTEGYAFAQFTAMKRYLDVQSTSMMPTEDDFIQGYGMVLGFRVSGLIPEAAKDLKSGGSFIAKKLRGTEGLSTDTERQRFEATKPEDVRDAVIVAQTTANRREVNLPKVELEDDGLGAVESLLVEVSGNVTPSNSRYTLKGKSTGILEVRDPEEFEGPEIVKQEIVVGKGKKKVGIATSPVTRTIGISYVWQKSKATGNLEVKAIVFNNRHANGFSEEAARDWWGKNAPAFGMVGSRAEAPAKPPAERTYASAVYDLRETVVPGNTATELSRNILEQLWSESPDVNELAFLQQELTKSQGDKDFLSKLGGSLTSRMSNPAIAEDPKVQSLLTMLGQGKAEKPATTEKPVAATSVIDNEILAAAEMPEYAQFLATNRETLAPLFEAQQPTTVVAVEGASAVPVPPVVLNPRAQAIQRLQMVETVTEANRAKLEANDTTVRRANLQQIIDSSTSSRSERKAARQELAGLEADIRKREKKYPIVQAEAEAERAQKELDDLEDMLIANAQLSAQDRVELELEYGHSRGYKVSRTRQQQLGRAIRVLNTPRADGSTPMKPLADLATSIAEKPAKTPEEATRREEVVAKLKGFAEVEVEEQVAEAYQQLLSDLQQNRLAEQERRLSEQGAPVQETYPDPFNLVNLYDPAGLERAETAFVTIGEGHAKYARGLAEFLETMVSSSPTPVTSQDIMFVKKVLYHLFSQVDDRSMREIEYASAAAKLGVTEPFIRGGQYSWLGGIRIGKEIGEVSHRDWMVEVLAHEWGHYWWYKHLRPAERAAVIDVYARLKATVKLNPFLEGELESNYGAQNAHEFYAELVMREAFNRIPQSVLQQLTSSGWAGIAELVRTQNMFPLTAFETHRGILKPLVEAALRGEINWEAGRQRGETALQRAQTELPTKSRFLEVFRAEAVAEQQLGIFAAQHPKYGEQGLSMAELTDLLRAGEIDSFVDALNVTREYTGKPDRELTERERAAITQPIDRTRQEVSAQLDNIESPNLNRLKPILTRLEKEGFDAEPVSDLVEEFRNILREDFDSTKDYQSERESKWEEITDAIREIEHPDEEFDAPKESTLPEPVIVGSLEGMPRAAAKLTFESAIQKLLAARRAYQQGRPNGYERQSTAVEQLRQKSKEMTQLYPELAAEIKARYPEIWPVEEVSAGGGAPKEAKVMEAKPSLARELWDHITDPRVFLVDPQSAEFAKLWEKKQNLVKARHARLNKLLDSSVPYGSSAAEAAEWKKDFLMSTGAVTAIGQLQTKASLDNMYDALQVPYAARREEVMQRRETGQLGAKLMSVGGMDQPEIKGYVGDILDLEIMKAHDLGMPDKAEELRALKTQVDADGWITPSTMVKLTKALPGNSIVALKNEFNTQLVERSLNSRVIEDILIHRPELIPSAQQSPGAAPSDSPSMLKRGLHTATSAWLSASVTFPNKVRMWLGETAYNELIPQLQGASDISRGLYSDFLVQGIWAPIKNIYGDNVGKFVKGALVKDRPVRFTNPLQVLNSAGEHIGETTEVTLSLSQLGNMVLLGRDMYAKEQALKSGLLNGKQILKFDESHIDETEAYLKSVPEGREILAVASAVSEFIRTTLYPKVVEFLSTRNERWAQEMYDELTGPEGMNPDGTPRNYWSIVRAVDLMQGSNPMKQVLEMLAAKRLSVNAREGTYKPRTGGSAPIVLEGMFENLHRVIGNAANMIGKYDITAKMQRMMMDPKLRETISTHFEFGESFLKDWKYMTAAIRGFGEAGGQIDKPFLALLNNNVAAVLRLAPHLPLYQVEQYGLTAAYVSPEAWIAGTRAFVNADLRAVALEELKVYAPTQYNRITAQNGMRGIDTNPTSTSLAAEYDPASMKQLAAMREADARSVIANWEAAKVESNGALKQAAKILNRIMLETQAQSEVFTMSTAQVRAKTNIWWRAATLLKAGQGKVFNMIPSLMMDYNASEKTSADVGRLVKGYVSIAASQAAINITRLAAMNAYGTISAAAAAVIATYFSDDPEDQQTLTENFSRPLSKDEIIDLSDRDWWKKQFTEIVVGVFQGDPLVGSFVAKGLEMSATTTSNYMGREDMLTELGNKTMGAMVNTIKAVNAWADNEVYQSGIRKGESKWEDFATKASVNLLEVMGGIRGWPTAMPVRLAKPLTGAYEKLPTFYYDIAYDAWEKQKYDKLEAVMMQGGRRLGLRPADFNESIKRRFMKEAGKQ